MATLGLNSIFVISDFALKPLKTMKIIDISTSDTKNSKTKKILFHVNPLASSCSHTGTNRVGCICDVIEPPLLMIRVIVSNMFCSSSNLPSFDLHPKSVSVSLLLLERPQGNERYPFFNLNLIKMWVLSG